MTDGPAGRRVGTRRAWLTAASLGLLVFLCAPGAASASHGVPGRQFRHGHTDACNVPRPGRARCFAEVATAAPNPAAAPLVSPGPVGYRPADLQAAYGLTAQSQADGAKETVAVVVAFDDPTAESDLAVYRQRFGLPECTTANGCFTKLNQTGVSGPLPPPDGNWSVEASLDLQAVSAICPNCHLTLVEADNNTIGSLSTAANVAAGLRGVTQVSNSYGTDETLVQASISSLDPRYQQPQVSMVVASGDSGFGVVNWPASSPNVTAVGGTALLDVAGGRGWTEQAWSGAGSGCSAFEPKIAGQPVVAGCDSTRRTVADVSAVADPNTGLAVFAPTLDPQTPGSAWQLVGGTSAASPIVAAYDALVGAKGPGFPYSLGASWFDVASGSNGTCLIFQLCHAVAGYDGPTGLGTPHGSGSPTPPPAPDLAAAPAVTGAAQIGQKLTAGPGEWAGPPPSFTFRWLRCTPTCAAIPGATASTYVPVAADAGARLQAGVVAANTGGSSAEALSVQTAPVASAAPPVPPAAATPPPASSTPAPAPVPSVTKAAFTPPPAPALAGLTMRPRTLRAGRRATVTFALNVPAFATLTVQRTRPGRRAGARCAAPTRANRARPACTRYVALKGALRFPKAGLAAAGQASLTIPGRLRGARLAPGRYRIAAIARTAAGQASKVVFATFRVVP